MKSAQLGSAATLIAGIALAGGALEMVRAQAPANTGAGSVPRTAWGDPDLQGKWAVADTGAPMERLAEEPGGEVNGASYHLASHLLAAGRLTLR